jgi:heterodisulfide reductase subunit C
MSIGGVIGVMTGFVTYISSVIVDKKVVKAKDEIETQMHNEHEKQSDSIQELGAQIINRMDAVSEDITEIGLNVAKVTQKQEDMQGHLDAVDEKAKRAEGKAQAVEVQVARLGG